jgi:predicted RNA-binding Zn-ribbon protein involved in translation (DUF1610 family)
MPDREEVYVCKRCGYVLPKRDAVVSGWDAEGSSTHVHCPRCGKIIARYIEQERRNRLELDRIDKVLFILSFLTLADTVSTEFSLMFGGMEGGPIENKQEPTNPPFFSIVMIDRIVGNVSSARAHIKSRQPKWWS